MAKVGRSKRSRSRDGDQAGNAGMPVGGGQHQDRRALAAADFHLGDARRLLDGLDLDALAFRVELVEARGDGQRMVLVVDGQQFACRAPHCRCGHRH